MPEVELYGFHGRLLRIRLESGKAEALPLEQARLRAFVGGIGLGTSLLYEHAHQPIDAFAADNPLIFASAPLVGTGLTTTAKFAVVTKSPLTGFITDSLSSSHFALELKRAGIDAMVITGRAPSLAYAVITDDGVEIRNAEHLRGKSPAETESAIRDEVRLPSLRVASIGAAGENRVRFASISNEGRHAGRGGAGAVMGAKNLKAIAVCGRHETPVWDAPGVQELALSLRQRSLGAATDKYRNLGTVANLSVFNRVGALPARNFQESSFEAADALSGETLTQNNFSRAHGCASCTIRCERLFKSLAGEQRLEYETLFALGPLCGIGDPAAVLEAARLCDEYGLDTISTGGTLAWAMESAARGLLSDGRQLAFGHADGLFSAIRAIGERRGIGDLLAEGSRRAAHELGHGSSEWAMHVKGLELPGYEPRTLKTMALGLAVSPRGACHNRSGAYEADFSGAVDRFHGDSGRGAVVAAAEDFTAVLDSLIVCKFLRKCFADFYTEGAELLSRVTGWDIARADMLRAAERIMLTKRLFNEAQGWQPGDDWLPDRLLNDAVASGAGRGATLMPAELREMIEGYYRARGLDDNGFVTKEKRNDLVLTSGMPAGERLCQATKHGGC